MKAETTWGSRAAESMFRVAVLLAGFDAGELMAEICRRSRGERRVNEQTVLNAMETVRARH